MKLGWGDRTSKNIRGTGLNPFGDMIKHTRPTDELAWNLQPMPNEAELNSAVRRQDKPSAANAAFNRRNPFLSGMDKALGVERTRRRYLGSQEQPEDAGYTPGDPMTTRKDNAPAGMTKRYRVTKTDVMNYRQDRGRRPPIFIDTANEQRLNELRRRQAKQAADDFTKGLELARSK
jgi:hypothetical protein